MKNCGDRITLEDIKLFLAEGLAVITNIVVQENKKYISDFEFVFSLDTDIEFFSHIHSKYETIIIYDHCQ